MRRSITYTALSVALIAGCADEADTTSALTRASGLAPVAQDAAHTIDEDTVLFDVLPGLDADGDALTFELASTPSLGTARIDDAAAGTFTYTPRADAFGQDTFTFRVRAGGEVSGEGTITVDVTGVEDAPEATPTSFNIVEDAPLTDTLTGADADGDAIEFFVSRQGTLGEAIFSDSTTGAFTYTPRPNANGRDSFGFRVTDGKGTSLEAEVIIDLAPINDAPAFEAPTPEPGAEVRGREGEAIALELRARDVDGDDLTYAVAPLPPGALLDTVTGAFTWTPGDGDAGVYELDVSATDGALETTRTIDVVVFFRDDDADGVPDSVERALGLETDSPDSDADGIPDAEEIGDPQDPRDTDGDLIPDALDDDSDADGVPDAEEAGDDDLTTAPVDTDEDDVPDYLDADSDDDGEQDRTDSCRLVPNPEQEDLDGDGLGDACDGDLDGDLLEDEEDNCPLVANVSQLDNDRDGIGDVCDGDDDNDGFTDDVDNCPEDPNRTQADEDGDGLGDACDPVDSIIDVPTVGGGGGDAACSSAPGGAPSAPLSGLALVGLAALAVGRRRRTR